MKELHEALAKAIAEMRDPKASSENNHFGNKYADLGEVLDCVREPLQKNGLLLLQLLTVAPASLHTRIVHIGTGQTIDSYHPLLPEKGGPQPFASCMTYARRYAIKALFGMVDVDDDGEAAQDRAPAKKTQPAKPRQENEENIVNGLSVHAAAALCTTTEGLTSLWNRAKKALKGKEWEIAKQALMDRKEALDAKQPVKDEPADYSKIPF